jgi:hypothetical protein
MIKLLMLVAALTCVGCQKDKLRHSSVEFEEPITEDESGEAVKLVD